MMETKTIKLRCESCGASLTAKEGKEFMYCEHCGTKIYLVAKQEIKHTHVDETKIRQAEIDAQLKREREKREATTNNNNNKNKLIMSLVLIGLSIFLVYLPFKIDEEPLIFFTVLPAIMCIIFAAMIHMGFPK